MRSCPTWKMNSYGNVNKLTMYFFKKMPPLENLYITNYYANLIIYRKKRLPCVFLKKYIANLLTFHPYFTAFLCKKVNKLTVYFLRK